MGTPDQFVGAAESGDGEVGEDELAEAHQEATTQRENMIQQEAEDLFEDVDEEGFGDASPERVTDDELFNEGDVEVLEKTADKDGNERFWEVEEKYDLEDEEAAPKKVLRDPREPSQQEWEDHRVDHFPYRSWCPFCVKGRGTGTPQ